MQTKKTKKFCTGMIFQEYLARETKPILLFNKCYRAFGMVLTSRAACGMI